jgi:hypothetical protein
MQKLSPFIVTGTLPKRPNSAVIVCELPRVVNEILMGLFLQFFEDPALFWFDHQVLLHFSIHFLIAKPAI